MGLIKNEAFLGATSDSVIDINHDAERWQLKIFKISTTKSGPVIDR